VGEKNVALLDIAASEIINTFTFPKLIDQICITPNQKHFLTWWVSTWKFLERVLYYKNICDHFFSALYLME